jgi:hypothetical protein
MSASVVAGIADETIASTAARLAVLEKVGLEPSDGCLRAPPFACSEASEAESSSYWAVSQYESVSVYESRTSRSVVLVLYTPSVLKYKMF